MRCAPSKIGAIEKIIARQEAVGLQSATDGEFRRSWWHFDFLAGLDGCQLVQLDHGIAFHGVQTKAETVNVVGKVGWPAHHPMIEHFKFLKDHTKLVPKMTIPSPSVLHFRSGYNAIKSVYPEIDEFFDDAAAAYGKAIRAFYDAGCRYLQLDDTVWAYLCSAEQREQAAARGDDVDRLQERYARTINKALESKPADMTITMHVCRGNFRSDLDFVGRLRAGGGDAARQASISTATSSSTIPSGPAVSSRCASCPRATRSSSSA